MGVSDIYFKFDKVFGHGGKIWVIGNGGSMAQASHLSEEFISLNFPVLALSDSSVISALGNDFGYWEVFSRYLSAVGSMGDLLVVLSTSGKSKNCLKAMKTAKYKGIDVVEWPRKGKTTEEIQNNQLKDIHKLYLKFK